MASCLLNFSQAVSSPNLTSQQWLNHPWSTCFSKKSPLTDHKALHHLGRVTWSFGVSKTAKRCSWAPLCSCELLEWNYLFCPLIYEKWKYQWLICVWLFVIPWTVAPQAPLSMEFSRQEYWSGLPFLSPEDLPNTGIRSGFPAIQADSLLSEPPWKPLIYI